MTYLMNINYQNFRGALCAPFSPLKVAGRPILMRFITFKVAVLFQQWTSVLTSSSMQFVCLSIGIDYSKF